MLLFKAKAKKSAARPPVKRKTREEIDADFDRINATLDRVALGHEKTEKTLDEIAAVHKQTEKTLDEIAAVHKQTEKTIDEIAIAHKQTEKALYKAFGDLSNTFGLLIEHIMTPDLPRKFEQFGFTFNRVTTIKWARGDGNIYAEIDGLVENGTQAIVVEVKTTLRRKDVDDHLDRMERVRIYADNHGDARAFFGAMAGAIIDEDTRRYALSKGFFVIEPSGEDVTVTKPDIDPKTW